ncbi:LysR family transcriptional regulator [Pseudoalteromonas sp. T1lg48]|uniref:LysR family transcriptional regulator n=1 Tax=Pseudoalteromonas sp. T1lg48 TaxID=2077100 RepID=UPI000CF6412B|nr:LysR family transcriptional regulator [Pseudoalteromonas sp. T1lg48]
MRFEQLKQFLALGSLRHFRQAAEQTNISTSALTRSIQTLEQEVGHQLVKRSTRSVILTEQGEMFLHFCRRTLDEYNQIIQRLDHSQGKRDNRLVVGYTNSASSIVPISCGQFMARHPEIKIEMQLQESEALYSMLKRGEIDIYVSEEDQDSNTIDIHLPDQLLLFARKDHPLASQDCITLEDLAPYPLFGCFSQSLHVQSMIGEAAQLLNKGDDIRLGSLGEIINCVNNNHNIAIAAIEHAKALSAHPELVQIRSNSNATEARFVVKTQQTAQPHSHLDELLKVITQTANAQGIEA